MIPRDADLKARHAASRVWNETWLSAFFHKPCNHELFVLQSLNMEAGIALAERDGADWLLHIDTDELMYPGSGPEYSLQTVLSAYPAAVDTVVFPNYEALPERDDVSAPFDQVTLFKRNYHHVVSDAYFRSYHAVARGNPNYFITYGNGKSAARVRPGLRPNGAHRWYSYNRAPRRRDVGPVRRPALHLRQVRRPQVEEGPVRLRPHGGRRQALLHPAVRPDGLPGGVDEDRRRAAQVVQGAARLERPRGRHGPAEERPVRPPLRAADVHARGRGGAGLGAGRSGPPDDAAADAAAVAAAVADPDNPRWGSREVLRGTRGSVAEEDLAEAAARCRGRLCERGREGGGVKAAGRGGGSRGRSRRPPRDDDGSVIFFALFCFSFFSPLPKSTPARMQSEKSPATHLSRRAIGTLESKLKQGRKETELHKRSGGGGGGEEKEREKKKKKRKGARPLRI